MQIMQLKKDESLAADDSEESCTDFSVDFQKLSESQNASRISKKQSRSLIKKALSKDLFLGEYTERRYVASLGVYRDIIVIDHTEGAIIESLKKVKEIVTDDYGTKKWIGITSDSEAEPNYYLWVSLDKLILGRYWFKIQSVYIEDKEIFLRLKAVRTYGSSKELPYTISDFYINEIFTLQNAWELFKFGFLLIMTIITCVFNSFPYIGEFILKLFREFNHLITVLTPLVLGILELVARCIGGFYWMIIMMFKSPNKMPYPMDNFKQRQRYNSLQWEQHRNSNMLNNTSPSLRSLRYK